MKRSLLICFFMVFSVLLSYFYADRWLVDVLSQHHTREWHSLVLPAEWLFRIILGFVFVACVVQCIAVLWRRYQWLNESVILFCAAITTTFFLKTFIKKIAGREWPATWRCHNLSYLHDHVYGFVGTGMGSMNLSFPSGHAAIAAAAMTVLAHQYPKYKVIFTSIALLVGFSMVAMYYHFLSDVLAGWYLGWFVAYCVTRFPSAWSKKTESAN